MQHEAPLLSHSRGADPVRRYLDSLSGKDAEEVFASLQYIEAHGIDGLVACRPIQGKLWELKVSQQRVFYVVITGPEMVLLHVYKKQSQKAPRAEIDLALRRMKEVLGG